MKKIEIINCQRVLSQTGITQADYVINPYRGCVFGCYYCYAQWNKFALKYDVPWGEYVHVKLNAPDKLSDELRSNPTGTVMLGSTTEVYQPAEKKYRVTRNILEKLSKTSMPVIILTRSPLITRDIDIFRKIKDVLICFTINTLDNNIVKAFEKSSPPVAKRIEAVEMLADAKIPFYIHAGPYLPYMTDPEMIIKKFCHICSRFDFENLNLKMMSKENLFRIIRKSFPQLRQVYNEIYENSENFVRFWSDERKSLRLLRKKYDCDINCYFHSYDSYFPIKNFKIK